MKKSKEETRDNKRSGKRVRGKGRRDGCECGSGL